MNSTSLVENGRGRTRYEDSRYSFRLEKRSIYIYIYISFQNATASTHANDSKKALDLGNDDEEEEGEIDKYRLGSDAEEEVG